MEKVLHFKSRKSVQDLRDYNGPSYTLRDVAEKFEDCQSMWASYEIEPAKDLFIEKCAFLRKWVPEINYRSPLIDKPRTPGPLRVGIMSLNLSKLSSVQFTTGTMAKTMKNVKVITYENGFKYPNFQKLTMNYYQDRKMIEDSEFDVLMYADVHLHKYTDMLAMGRLARVQITTWGHSDTSGMDSIDHYITSSMFEHTDCQKYYSENVLLDKSLTVYYPNLINDRELCKTVDYKYMLLASSPYKVNDDNMKAVKEIQDRTGVVLLIVDYEVDSHTVDILDRVGIKYTVTKRVPVREFMGLLKHAEIVLDTHPFGNCNIAFQTFMAGGCTVTYPSDRLYGRFVQGLYKKMGITNPGVISHSWDDYVEKNVQMIADSVDIRKQVLSNVHKIIEDTESVTNIVNIFNTISSGVPQILHFVYGLKQVEELCFVHFMAVWSAMFHNKISTVYFWYHHEPVGKWWDTLKPHLTLRKVELDSRFKHYAHHADFVRLQALYEHGGMYLDMDTVTCKPLDVSPGGVTIGSQTKPHGLCNAIMASVPRSQFLRKWMDNCKDNYGPPGTPGWDYNSVKLPLEMYKRGEVNVTIRPDWHKVHWSEAERHMFDDENVVPTQPVYHLCESMYYDRLTSITPDTMSGLYKKIVRQFCTIPPMCHDFSPGCALQKGVKSWSDSDIRSLIGMKFPTYRDTTMLTQREVAKHMILYSMGGSEYPPPSEIPDTFSIIPNPLSSRKGDPSLLNRLELATNHYITDAGYYVDMFRMVWTEDGTNVGYVSRDTVYDTDGNTKPHGDICDRVIRCIPKKSTFYEKPLEPIPADADKPTGTETLTWIVALHNRENLIRETVNSIITQTVPCKCIICDDGSSDKSLEVVRELTRGREDMFTIVVNEENIGYPLTCRKLNDLAQTDIVAIVDSDDVLCQEATNVLLSVYRNRKCVMAVSGRYNWDGGHRRSESRAFVSTGCELINDQYEHVRSWRKACLPDSAFRGDIRYAEDRDLFYRMEELGTIVQVHEPLVFFRHHGNSIMSHKLELARRDHCKAKLCAMSRRGFCQ